MFCLLFVSRIITTLMLMPSLERTSISVDMLPRVLLWDALIFLFVLPIFVLYDRGKSGILDYAQTISPVMCKAVAVILSLYFLYQNVELIAGFEVFSTTVVFPELNSILFIVLFTLVCAYIASLGLESIARASSVVAVMTVIIVGLLLLTLISQVRMFNFTPVFYDGPMPAVSSALRSVANTAEIAVLAVVMPHVTGKIKRMYAKWVVWMSLCILILSFFAVGALGAFADTQLFPFYTLAEIANVGIFQRLDSIMTSVWAACAVIKSSLFVYLFAFCMKRAFPKPGRGAFIWIFTAITALCTAYISLDEQRYIQINQYALSVSAFAVVVIALPLLLLLLGAIRKRRQKGGDTV